MIFYMIYLKLRYLLNWPTCLWGESKLFLSLARNQVKSCHSCQIKILSQWKYLKTKFLHFRPLLSEWKTSKYFADKCIKCALISIIGFTIPKKSSKMVAIHASDVICLNFLKGIRKPLTCALKIVQAFANYVPYMWLTSLYKIYTLHLK